MPPSVSSPNTPKVASAPRGPLWHTLRHQTYRAIWTASLCSQVGTWMQNLGAQWLMTSLTDSPLLVGLVQTATMLPGVGLALLAGALADMLDRRHYMLVVLGWATCAAGVLAAVTGMGLISPSLLLMFVFAVGLANAAMIPAMSATLQDIVPREEVLNAVTLNSLSINLSRSVGPAIAGLLIGYAGTQWAFLLNALSFLFFFVVIFRWAGAPRAATAPTSFAASIVGGIKYAQQSARFKALLGRSVSFFLTGSATMALLPLYARLNLDLDAQHFGLLLGAIGIGAIATGVFGLGWLNARFQRDEIILVASLIAAASMGALSQTSDGWITGGILFVFGASWMTCLVSFQVSSQMLLPAWVRARGLSISVMCHMGSMALAGALWGWIGRTTDLSTAIGSAGAALAILSVLTYRFKVSSNVPDDADQSSLPDSGEQKSKA